MVKVNRLEMNTNHFKIPTIQRKQKVSLEGVVGSKVNRSEYGLNGHWDFPGKLDPDNFIGFIYIIVDLNNKKLYLGKKQYKGAGKLNKGKESNWPWYISSSTELSEQVKKYGKEGFDFIAVEQYKSKGALSYAETWSLMFVESPSNRHLWYNMLVNKISWNVREGITQQHKDRLTAISKIFEDKNDTI
jgi:hypothetical protein